MFSAGPTTTRTGPAIQVSTMILETKTMNVKSRYVNVKKVSLQPATKRCDGVDSSQWLGTAENYPISSPMRLLIQKLFWDLDEGFKIASCIVPLTRYLCSIQILRVIRWSLFLFNHLQTVLLDKLLRDTTQCVQSPCILLNLLLRLAAVGCTLQWTLGAEINKQLQLLFATTLTH